MTHYYELSLTDVVAPQALTFGRAKALFQAARQNGDCAVIECRRSQDGNREIIVVDVQCDGVPSRNKVGIKFRERVALVVPQSDAHLVSPLMLRKDFPKLIHQNGTFAGYPRELCLYFEPRESVARTWTAQRFIRRVQWWLTASATNSLHAADQPPEVLFFNARDELVVPAHFESLLDKGQKFRITSGPERSNGGATYQLVPTNELVPTSAVPLHITLPPVVHGAIEDTPSTLAEFVDLAAQRGVELLPLLRGQVGQRIGDQGASQPFGGDYVILICHIPMKRTEEEAPSQTHHRAFIIFRPFLDFGTRIGALVEVAGKYSRFALVGGQAVETRGLDQILMLQLDFLRKNSAQAFRDQSGIADAGGDCVLVGAGALGSSMMNLWARSGWGRWTIVDKDHVKPHNLTRHTAWDAQIGTAKSTTVAALAATATNEPGRFNMITADALASGNAQLEKALTEASLVVDASTILEYPRMASERPDFGRHFSVFLTPSGNSSVLLAESADRSITLRTLEAQYYRAILDEPWGKQHLTGHIGTFWSGGSCRDISFKLPLAHVQAHAANLAVMTMKFAKQEDAQIAVWSRDAETGAIEHHRHSVHTEFSHKVGEYTVYCDEGVGQALHGMREMALPNETGGILLGYYDLTRKTIVVVKAEPPPPDSVGTQTSFERGTVGVVERLKDAADRTADIVQYIGEWHTHPRGHSAHPSQDDLIQLTGLALSMQEDGLPALQLIVGERGMSLLIAGSA